MIELPEARTIARDLRKEIIGKTITAVGGNFEGHKFTFYYADPYQYEHQLIGKKITSIIDRNYYVEIEAEDYKIMFRDGANIRFYDNRQDHPEKSKFLLEFQDGSFLNVTIAMYGFIAVCRNGAYANEYYEMEVNGVGVLDPEFNFTYFQSLITPETEKLSLKAFLATEQRILGIGNGVVQDILFQAGFLPKRKLNTLTESELQKLYMATKETILNMTEKGGRDTEKNIYGEVGGYKTILSSKSYKVGVCPHCHDTIKKESYLGGTIYYCPTCQK